MKPKTQVAVVGLGRTGCRLAVRLLDLGLTRLTLIDRDYLEAADLRDCPLYKHAREFEPKAQAAKAALEKLYPKAKLTDFTVSLDSKNAARFLSGAKVVCDDTDNWLARKTIGEHCWKTRKPWVYCGALKHQSMVSTLIPGQRPCWSCWNPSLQKPVSCTAFGLDPKAAVAAARMQGQETILICLGKRPRLTGKLWAYDSQTGEKKILPLHANPRCSMCGNRARVSGLKEKNAYYLCGSGQYQFTNKGLPRISRRVAMTRLSKLYPKQFGILTQVHNHAATAMIFPDGRTIVRAKGFKKAMALNSAVVNAIYQN
jgi:adenylyltransferase/sulfurtransferase